MTLLGARRLAEQVELGTGVVAIELVISVQACDLRGQPLGNGTRQAHAAVRNVVSYVGEGDPLPDLEPLLALVRSGSFV
jgi:histidine ammonia-lyase